MVLVFAIFFSLSLTNVNAKYIKTDQTVTNELAKFDFGTSVNSKITDYSTYENKVYVDSANGTLNLGGGGGAFYEVSYDAENGVGVYSVKSGAKFISAIALKLINVIDSTKFENNKKYKVSFNVKSTGYVVSGSTAADTYIATDDTAVKESDIISALNGQNYVPGGFILNDATGATDVGGTTINNSKGTNGEWTTVTLKEFTATQSFIGTNTYSSNQADSNYNASLKNYTTASTASFLKASSIRMPIYGTTVTVNGVKYSVYPAKIEIDDVVVTEDVETTVANDNREYVLEQNFDSLNSLPEMYGSCGQPSQNAYKPANVGSRLSSKYAHSGTQSVEKVTNDVSCGLRFTNIFGEDVYSEDIGKVFKISMWVYADKTAGVITSGGKELITSGEEYDASNYASFQLRTCAPGNRSDLQYQYSTNAYKAYNCAVPWNKWTELVIYHEVTADNTADTPMGTNGSTPVSYMVNSVRLCQNALNDNLYNSDPMMHYLALNYYVDDFKVEEVETYPNEIVQPVISQEMFKACDERNAVFSKIVIKPSESYNTNSLYTYMIRTSKDKIGTNVSNTRYIGEMLSIVDRKVINLPKIIGDESGTITLFSILDEIPEDMISENITSKVIWMRYSPYVYLNTGRSFMIDDVTGSVATSN